MEFKASTRVLGILRSEVGVNHNDLPEDGIY